MGVPGLHKFIAENSKLTSEHELCNQRIVIDGSNFVYVSYRCSEADLIFGGDYKVFGDYIRSYFSSLQECGVNPIVVFDGGLDKSEKELERKKIAHKTRVETVFKLVNEIDTIDMSRGINKEVLLPVCAYEVLKMVLLDMGIKVVQTDFKADNQITSLANYYECPVLSNDNDFYIFDLPNGFIVLKDFIPCVQTKANKNKYIKCKIYKRDTVISHFHLKDKEMFPLFAALLLFRNQHYDESRNFFQKIGVHKNNERFQKLLHWLKEFTLLEALAKVMACIEDKKSCEDFLKGTMQSYNSKPSNLRHIVEKNTDEIIKYSQLSINCEAKLPEEFILAFHRGLASSFFSVLTRHCMFLSAMIEDFSLKSSHSCSRHLRKIILGILLRHASHKSENHNQKCLKTVYEFDRATSKDAVEELEVKYLSKLENGVKVPKLTKIYEMDKSELRDFIKAALNAAEPLFEDLPADLQLFFYCVHYWSRNCTPSESLKKSLLLCVIYHQVERASSQNEANESVSLFKNIHKSDVRNIEEYLKVPSKIPYDLKVVHSYNQLQICVLDAVQLNWLVGFPFASPKPHELFCGTLLYNLAKEIQLSENKEDLIKRLLGDKPVIITWLEKMIRLLK